MNQIILLIFLKEIFVFDITLFLSFLLSFWRKLDKCQSRKLIVASRIFISLHNSSEITWQYHYYFYRPDSDSGNCPCGSTWITASSGYSWAVERNSDRLVRISLWGIFCLFDNGFDYWKMVRCCQAYSIPLQLSQKQSLRLYIHHYNCNNMHQYTCFITQLCS